MQQIEKPTYKYDLVVLIGRFQPFHNAHKNLVKRASLLAPNVLVVVGSAGAAPNIKNPWSYDERYNMIRESTNDISADIFVRPVRDYRANIDWIEEVNRLVEGVLSFPNIRGLKIGIIGHSKDLTSTYLNYFPQWDLIEAPAYPERGETIDATKIRKLYFKHELAFIEGVVPNPVFDILNNEEKTDLHKEYDFVQAYIKSWDAAPFPPTFVTVDSVVVQSGHVLLIQRGGYPGKGQWALPGGFLDQTETLEKASIRELREETRLKIPVKVLKGSLLASEVFDSPGRSTRGRTITHAFLYHLDDAETLPKVKGSDDAVDAQWKSFSEFRQMRSVMYEDHWFIIEKMVSILEDEEF